MRILLTIQYVGTNYHGWQIQPGKTTVQGVLEDAIFKALNEKCETFASGRTDAGVHAYAQMAHFDTTTKIDPQKISFVINKFLPDDVQVLKSEQVESTFNARFDVKKKTYEYNFYVSNQVLPLLEQNHARVKPGFSFLLAKQACKHFLGEHDFVGFSSAGRQTKTTVRTIYSLDLLDLGNSTYKIVVTGNGFLYNMVRIIAGTLFEVGAGKIHPQDLPSIINSKDRSKAGKTSSAKGLVLKKVEYNI